MIEIIALVLVLVASLIYLLRDPPLISGLYRQKGALFSFKCFVFGLLLRLRKSQHSKTSGDAHTPGFGVKSRECEDDMDRCQELPDVSQHPMAVDAVYFASSSKDGYYLVTATSRRQHGKIQMLLYLRVPGVGLFELPIHPETLAAASEKMAWSAEGLTISPLVTMKSWRIQYCGQLRLTQTGVYHQVKFDLVWTACGRYFDFDTDMHSGALCEAVALEKWSRDLFKRMQDLHQTHYEQFGCTKGLVDIEGHGQFELCLHGVRDHSYGNIRIWKDLFRYCLQYIHLEDGTDIAVGAICMPKTLSRLVIGYMMRPDGQMDVVSWSNFEFYQWGDDGTPPQDFHFDFKAGAVMYHLECSVVDAPIFYMRDSGRAGAIIHERMCTFTLNGAHATGISEWCYEDIDRHRGKAADRKVKDSTL